MLYSRWVYGKCDCNNSIGDAKKLGNGYSTATRTQDTLSGRDGAKPPNDDPGHGDGSSRDECSRAT